MAGLLLCSSYFTPYQNREAYSPVNDGYIGQCKEKIHTLQVTVRAAGGTCDGT